MDYVFVAWNYLLMGRQAGCLEDGTPQRGTAAEPYHIMMDNTV